MKAIVIKRAKDLNIFIYFDFFNFLKIFSSKGDAEYYTVGELEYLKMVDIFNFVSFI